MAKAKKLPSGSWRCLVYSHSEPMTDTAGKPVMDAKTGKQKMRRVYESFTSDDPTSAGRREAERMAAIFAAQKELPQQAPVTMTFGEALDAYIKSRALCAEGRSVLLTLTILRGIVFMCAKIWSVPPAKPGS